MADIRAIIWRPRLLAAIACVLALVLLVSLAVRRVSAHAGNKPVDITKLYWILFKEDLTRINAADPDLVQQLLSSPAVFAYEHAAGYPPLPAKTIPVQLFFSNADLETAVQNHGILPGVQWAAYDPENWSATPVAEKQDPLPFMQRFAKTASDQGLKSIMVPGRDLMLTPGATCSQKQGQNISQAFVSCGIPHAAASYAPIFVIQSAPIETDHSSLVELVQTAARRLAWPIPT